MTGTWSMMFDKASVTRSRTIAREADGRFVAKNVTKVQGPVQRYQTSGIWWIDQFFNTKPICNLVTRLSTNLELIMLLKSVLKKNQIPKKITNILKLKNKCKIKKEMESSISFLFYLIKKLILLKFAS